MNNILYKLIDLFEKFFKQRRDKKMIKKLMHRYNNSKNYDSDNGTVSRK